MEEIDQARKTHMEQAQKDHDLLIEIKTDLRTLTKSVDDVKNDLSGRVGRLETQVETLKMKFWIMMGGGGVIMAAVIPMGIYIFNDRTNISKQVQSGVTAALQVYSNE